MTHIVKFCKKYQIILGILFSGAGVVMISDFFSPANSVSISVSGDVETVIHGEQNDVDNRQYHQHGYSQEDIAKIIESATKALVKENQLLMEEKRYLTEAVEALSQLNTNKYDIEDALALLSEGKTAIAKGVFSQIAEEAEANKIHEAAAAYRHLGALAFWDDTAEALAAYKRSVELDPKNKEGWNRLGLIYKRKGYVLEAENAYLKVLDLSADGQANQATAYGNLGNLYISFGEMDRAVRFYQKALGIFEALGVTDGIASSYGNLANIYREKGELDKAMALYRQVLVIEKSMSRQEGIANAYASIGKIYRIQGDVDSAITYYNKTLAIDKKRGDKPGIASVYDSLGNAYIDLQKWDKANDYYQQALSINKALDVQGGIASNYVNLGTLKQMQGELNNAHEYYAKAITIFENIGDKHGMAVCYGNLGAVYERLGDLEKTRKLWQKELSLYKEMGLKSKAERAQFYLNGIASLEKNRDAI